jgi:hypothetical protein
MMCKLSVPFFLDCCHTEKQWMIWRLPFIPLRILGWKLQEQLANGNELDVVLPMAVQFHAILYGLPQDYGYSDGFTQQLLKLKGGNVCIVGFLSEGSVDLLEHLDIIGIRRNTI